MKDVKEILERVKRYEEFMKQASEELADGHSNDAPNWDYWSRNFDEKTKEAEDSLLQDLRMLIKEYEIAKISDLVRKNTIAVLEKMKVQEDEDASRAALCDSPNASWYYQAAKDNKKAIDDFISMLGAKSYESMRTLVLDTIIKESVKAANMKE